MAIARLEHSQGKPASLRQGSSPISLSNLMTAAFLGRTVRGPVNEPVCVESFAEFCRYFGGHFAGGAVSHAVHDFFLHGGRRAVIVRLVNRATRASLDLPAGDQVLKLQARYPGRREVLRAAVDYERTEGDESSFNLVIQRLRSEQSSVVEDQEIYPLISTQPSEPRYIGDVIRNSQLIALAGPVPAVRPDATPPERPGEPMRYVMLSTPGDDGDELTDYDIIGSDRDRTGLFCLARGPGIDVLSIPLPASRRLGSTAFLAAARFCEAQRTLLIWDPPGAWNSPDAALLGARQLEFTSRNIVTYFPRVRPRGTRPDPAGGMPACGAIAGMLARRDQRGIWDRDTQADYQLRSALAPVVNVSESDARRLSRHGFNVLAQSKGGAIRLAGRVTMGAAGLGMGLRSDLELRRLGLFILNSVESAAGIAAGESDVNAAVVRLEGQLRRFFDDLYLRNALKGQTPGQSYYLHAGIGISEDSSGAAGSSGIRFGFALYEPGRFLEYQVDLAGEDAGIVRRIRAVEAEQLFS